MARPCAETPMAAATAAPAANARTVERLRKRLRNDRLPESIGLGVIMVGPCKGWGGSRSPFWATSVCSRCAEGKVLLSVLDYADDPTPLGSPNGPVHPEKCHFRVSSSISACMRLLYSSDQ